MESQGEVIFYNTDDGLTQDVYKRQAERSPDCKNAKDRCDAWGLSGILV